MSVVCDFDISWSYLFIFARNCNFIVISSCNWPMIMYHTGIIPANVATDIGIF